MSKCVVLGCAGEAYTVQWDQGEISKHLGGQITFVGGVPSLNAFAVALADSNEACNPYVLRHKNDFFVIDVRGDVVIVASDEHGNEVDVDADAVLAHFDACI